MTTFDVPPQGQSSPSPGCYMASPHPWNSQTAQASNVASYANSGVSAFEPPPAPPYYMHITRQELLDTGQSTSRTFGPEPVSPAGESESDGWVVPSYPSSYAASHGSPKSHNSPASHISSPPQHEPEHQHIFTSHPDVPKPRPLRGRQRGLTTQEKKQARDVREAKACWACHISKIKVRQPVSSCRAIFG